MSKETGTCDDYMAVWYFEPISRSCRRFLYSGCGGNGNRFSSQAECESTCLHERALDTEHVEHHHVSIDPMQVPLDPAVDLHLSVPDVIPIGETADPTEALEPLSKDIDSYNMVPERGFQCLPMYFIRSFIHSGDSYSPSSRELTYLNSLQLM